MDKSMCCYPDCQNCPYEDCIVERPDKNARWHRDPEKSRLAQQLYRERRRKRTGILSQKERMIQQQDKVYEFLLSYISEHLYPPSITEISEAVGITCLESVTRDLKRLQERGLIVLEKGYRAIRLVGYRLTKEADAVGE